MQKMKLKKFKTRSLTKNEKFLLTALGIVISIWAIFSFILTPQGKKIELLEIQKIDYENKILQNTLTLKKQKRIEKEWELLDRERDKILSKYFPKLDQAQIIYLLNDLIEEDSVEINNMNFTRPSMENIGEIDVNQMSVSIPFSGEYDGIMNIIKSMNNSPRRIALDRISIDQNGSKLAGNIDLKIYSLEGIAETDPDIIYIDQASNHGITTPFSPYDDIALNDFSYENNENNGDFSEDIGSNIDGICSEDNLKEQTGEVLHDFELNNFSFLPSNPLVKGSAIRFTNRKSGKYSLRLEYNILALEKENRAYVDLSKPDIEFKIPPSSVGVWVNSYSYSPGTLGMNLKTQSGDKVNVKITESINWMGWKYIEFSLPEDLKLYPLKLENIYFEIPYNRDEYGVILLDKLETFYPENSDKSIDKNEEINDFYVVKPGDNINKICEENYGTLNYKKEIMDLNDIKPGEDPSVGKVLILKRH